MQIDKVRSGALTIRATGGFDTGVEMGSTNMQHVNSCR